MPLELSWIDIAARLSLTAFAAALIGLERGEQGRAAGLRTTLLVGLAAALAMTLANLLVIQAATRPDVFRTFDALRLPLGILSGMGFIGAGAILHRKDLVIGVTTAATLWFVTVAGLCFGSGQLALGAVAGALGLVVLRGLEWAEDRIRRDRFAVLDLELTAEGPREQEIRARIEAAGYRVASRTLRHDGPAGTRRYAFDLAWHGRRTERAAPPIFHELAGMSGVASVEWKATQLEG